MSSAPLCVQCATMDEAMALRKISPASTWPTAKGSVEKQQKMVWCTAQLAVTSLMSIGKCALKGSR